MRDRRQVRLPVGIYALQIVDGKPERSFLTSLSECGLEDAASNALVPGAVLPNAA